MHIKSMHKSTIHSRISCKQILFLAASLTFLQEQIATSVPMCFHARKLCMENNGASQERIALTLRLRGGTTSDCIAG